MRRFMKEMEETQAYRSEYLVIWCPYCDEQHYIDIEDDMGEGRIPEKGRTMTCKYCGREFRVMPD